MPIYNGSQKVSFPGIEKIYVGNDLVYQKQAAYIRLLYLESTSNAKGSFNIQTDIPILKTDILTIDYQLTKATYNQSSGQYYGALISSNNLDTRIGYTDNYANRYITYWNGQASGSYATRNSDFNTNRQTLQLFPAYSNRISCRTEMSNYLTCSSTTPGDIEKFSLFSQTYNGDQPSILAKIYSVTIIDNNTGVLKHELIPVLQNNIPGFLDTITNSFYSNNGSGTFRYEVAPTSDYRELEYIKFTGTQYIPINLQPANLVRTALYIEHLVDPDLSSDVATNGIAYLMKVGSGNYLQHYVQHLNSGSGSSTLSVRYGGSSGNYNVTTSTYPIPLIKDMTWCTSATSKLYRNIYIGEARTQASSSGNISNLSNNSGYICIGA